MRKQLTVVLVIMSFMAGSYSQKSSTAMNEDSNIRYLKNLAAVISNLENVHTGSHIKPIKLENVGLYSNNLNVDEFILVPAYSANEVNLADEEEEMQVEDWMLDEEHFRINNSYELNDIAEEEMQIEDWMLDEEHFRIPVSNDDALYEVAEEEKLAIEEWMLDESHFLSNNNLIEDEITAEDKLKVENWMLDPDHWVSRAD